MNIEKGSAMKLSGKVALILGGSSGLGRASAEACAREGASIVIADVNEAAGKDTVAAIAGAGGSAVFVSTDGVDDAQVKAAVDSAVARFGGLDILITSIGGGAVSGDAGWHRSIDLYLKSTYYACKHAIVAMKSRGGGAIVTVASISGVTGGIATQIEDSGYTCAKHGVIGLTRTLALAHAKDNIRVNAICPGYFKTPMTRQIYDTPDGGVKFVTEHLRVPMGRWGEPREIGSVAAFLASDDASFITGQPIIVDGGFMAR